MQVWVAFAGLLFTVVSALLVGAFKIGRMAEKIEAMKEGSSKEAGTHDDVIVLKTQMAALTETIAEIKQGVGNLQSQLAHLAGRRGGPIVQFGDAP